MPYFQNPFDQLFQGSWGQETLTWQLPGNINSSTLMVAWKPEPYNLSSGSTLTINYNLEASKAYYASLAINVAGTVLAATTAQEIVSALNANPTFAGLFKAETRSFGNDPTVNALTVVIRAVRPRETFRAYVANTGAEMAMRFNKQAAIGEMPTYFRRHTVPNYGRFESGEGMLLELDTSNTYHQMMITEAKFNPNIVRNDSQLMAGRSGSYKTKKMVYDGNNRVASSIEFPTGSTVGALAKKISYGYNGNGTNPTSVSEEPYTLTTDDLV